MHVVMQMPIMVEPQPIDEEQSTEVSRALLDVPNGAKVMRVLHRGPDEAESKKRCKVIQQRYMPVPDEKAMEQNDQKRLQTHKRLKPRVKAFDQSLGRPVE